MLRRQWMNAGHEVPGGVGGGGGGGGGGLCVLESILDPGLSKKKIVSGTWSHGSGRF